MNKNEQKKLMEQLSGEKQELEKIVEDLKLKQSLKESTGELSSYDNHPADQASELYERSTDQGLLELTRRQIDAISEAQAALRDGSYGICKVCGKGISSGRLKALPSTTYCVHCKREQEERDWPYEKDNLFPPDALVFVDEADELGDDAWDLVARYGTSSYIEKD